MSKRSAKSKSSLITRKLLNYNWIDLQSVEPRVYTCGFCGYDVSANEGYCVMKNDESAAQGLIYICTSCRQPTYFSLDKKQYPGALPGKSVDNVPDDLNKLYTEARGCYSVGAYTAVVIICRKMLMNIAVKEGAKEGSSFTSYIQYLIDQGFISNRNKSWVDHIRTKGNEATHTVESSSEEDANTILILTEGLLRNIYEYPSRALIKPIIKVRTP